MAVLAAMQSAAIRLFGRKPPAFFASAGTFELELCDLVNEVATDVAKYRDWQKLQRIATIEGDGTASAFDLPADYDRMMLTSELQDPRAWLWGYQHFPDLTAFTLAQTRGFQPLPGGWIVSGGKVRFAPTPPDGQRASYPYITANYALSAGGVPKAAFDADTDTFLLPERLLTLGLVWRWRENKKLDATGDQEAFIKALDEYAAKDGGARVYRYGGRRTFPGTHTAWPYVLGG